MPMDPAQFYQLGAQAGAQRMGGLPENLDKNRQLSMQLAPTLMAAETNQEEMQYMKPYYEALTGYNNKMASLYGQKYDPTTMMAIQKSKEDIALRGALAKLLTSKNLGENLRGLGVVGTGPKQGGFFGVGAKPSYTTDDLVSYLQAQQMGDGTGAETTDPTEAALLQQLQMKLMAASSQTTV